MKKEYRVAALGLAAWFAMGGLPAYACLGCGGSGSGVSADLGAVGGASSLFSMGQRWLIQESMSLRAATGSFNELGTWNPVPVGGSLTTLQASLGVSYFPTLDSALSIQLPFVGNSLDKASWGPWGSITPTDTPRANAASLGDAAIQGTYKFFETGDLAFAAWLGANLPTGQAAGDPAGLSGSGVVSGQGGLIALTHVGNFEFTGNLGYQRPFSNPTAAGATFFTGESWLYQLQGNYRLSDAWRLGLGINGFQGRGQIASTNVAVPTSKLKLVPSAQFAWNPDQGVRVAAGYDPATLGTNTMTDFTVYTIFYQYTR
jgi:hypothetical protein